MAARQAHDLCLRMLTDRARTRHELNEVLRNEGLTGEIIDSVLNRLVALRLIDDAAYAESFVRSRQRAGVAKRSVTRELHAKGIAEPEAEAALATIDPKHERETARLLATRRAARTVGMPIEARRRRLYGLLARRGYPSDLVRSVVDQVLGEAQEDDREVQDLDRFDL
ncbi:MAG TPA: RecX family transcriptional regulator [Frankiaceae bacterium]|nr:RecX family transcriptional regulator [Frankiaceae bacterium]